MKQTLIFILLLQSAIGYGQVRLNEMQSSNSTTLGDNFGEYDDWVEIHNPTNDSIEIGGLVLKDQLDTWAIPTGDPTTHLPPNGYILLWADDQEGQGVFHTNFKLASGGEFLGLYESDSITIIDSITITALGSDQSYIRCESEWLTSSTPSPLVQNDCSANVHEVKTFDDLFNFAWNSDGLLVINILNAAPIKYHLSLYNAEGRKLTELPLNEKKTVLDLQTNGIGNYFAIISTGSATYSKRILVLK